MIVKNKNAALFGCAAILLVLFSYTARSQEIGRSSQPVNALRAVPARLTLAAMPAAELDTPTPTPTAFPTLEPKLTATATPTARPPNTVSPTRTVTADKAPTATTSKMTLPADSPSNLAAPAVAAAAPACGPGHAQTYVALSVNGASADRPAAMHADLNLGLRGWVETDAPRSLLTFGGPADARAPQLVTLFAPRRIPEIAAAYAVYNWDFGAGRRTVPVALPVVSMLGLTTASGEPLYLPSSGYDIGEGQNAIVLYAAPSRITLKYTREDNVANGYTIHVENVCVDPQLLALYQSLNAAGRRQLPGMHNGQTFGSASGTRILIGIQDSGAWMDPRARKDWWQER